MEIIKTNKYAQKTDKQLFIVRGVSGSGKSYLAKDLGKEGHIFSTDDFFNQTGTYKFDPKKLGKAHKWNQNNVENAMQNGLSPIVVDNTNSQKWEILPYVKMAQEYGYEIEFAQPDWHPDLYTEEGKWNIDFLADKNVHGVPKKSVQKMIDRYDYDPSVEDILESKSPWEN